MNRRGYHVSALHSDVPGIEWPPVVTNVAGAVGALLRQLEDTQWMSPEEIEARQFHQLRVLAEYAEQHSPQFRRRMSLASLRARDLTSRKILERLPVLRRRDVQTAGADLYCAAVPQQHLPINEIPTSGSTGEPVVVRRTAINQLFHMALSIRGHSWNGDDFSQRYAAIRPTYRTYDELPNWGPPCNLLFNTGRAQIMPIAVDARQHVQWLADFKPYFLLGFPSIIDAICRYCRRHDMKLPGLGEIRTFGETVSPHLREAVQATLSARLIDGYSSNEVGNIAMQCPAGDGYHVMAESLIVEVVDEAGRACADGDVGRVVVTDLHNFATPLIRYDIGDYAEMDKPCRCGRGLPTIRRILGRARNFMLMPDGTRRYPLVGFYKFRDVAPVSQYQLIQYGPADLEARLVVESPLTARQEADLRTVILTALRAPFELKFAYFPDQIPRSPSGKFEEFVCKIPLQES